MSSYSEMKKMRKINEVLIFLEIVLLLLIIIGCKFNNILWSIIIVVPLIFIFSLNWIYKNNRVKRLSKNIYCNQKAKFFQISTDGKRYELYQKISKEYVQKKPRILDVIKYYLGHRVKDSKIPISQYKLLASDLKLIVDWLNGIPDIKIEILTHNGIIKILERYFDVTVVKKVKPISHFAWIKISLNSRGVLLERPKKFYKIELRLK